MNAQTQSPSISTMLAQVACVVSISTTSLGLNRLDKQSSRMLDMQKNASPGTGKVSASRLAGGEAKVKEINKVAAEISAALSAVTTAYQDRRLLANTQLQHWLDIYAPLKAKYDGLVAEFVAEAPQLIAGAEMNKGSYNVETPSLDEIESAFSLTFDMQPIPDASQFRATGVNAQLEAEMRRHFEASVEAAYTQATNDALNRVAKPLAALAERMEQYSQREIDKARGVTVDKTGTFKDSIIGNVQDIAQVFRSFNILGDPIMDDLAKRLDAFHGIDGDDLRSDAGLRKDVTAKAKAILADLEDLL